MLGKVLKLMAVVLTFAARLTTSSRHEWLTYADKTHVSLSIAIHQNIFLEFAKNTANDV